MKKLIKIALVILVIVGGITLASVLQNKRTGTGFLGYDSENSVSETTGTKEFNQVGLTASRSQQGLVKATSGKLVGIEITSDTASLRYFQLFDKTTVTIPARTASLSYLAIYKGSTSWASAANQVLKPVGGYQRYASASLVFSMPIPGAASSASPTVVRIDAAQLGGFLSFHTGITFGISSVFGSFSSASVNTARHTVKLLYQ